MVFTASCSTPIGLTLVGIAGAWKLWTYYSGPKNAEEWTKKTLEQAIEEMDELKEVLDEICN